MKVPRLNTKSASFEQKFARLCARGAHQDERIGSVVRRIVEDVRTHGDSALVEHTRKLDGWTPKSPLDLEVPEHRLVEAPKALTKSVSAALKMAVGRITEFHEHQKEKPVSYRDAAGNRIEQRVRPLERVGVYVPGGRGCYPSSVLMTALVAKVAGVEEIVMVSPTHTGEHDTTLLAAAAMAGVSKVYRVGGAQAVAALAFGTQLVPKVDKIVGPGNAWVAAAKRQVRGVVDVDMEAGPSEVLIVADKSARANWVAADLIAQAEHDPEAVAVLVTDDAELLEAVEEQLERQVKRLDRREIAEESLQKHGAVILVEDIDEALHLANRFAPEHLELLVEKPRSRLGSVRHAGAVFLGPWTPEAVGDYVAGPSHVLPTGGTARFGSPLGVRDFMSRTSVLEFTRKGLNSVATHVRALAEIEGLQGHARAVELRGRK